MPVPTREVYNAKGHFLRINASDFDPEKHFDEPPKAQKSSEPAKPTRRRKSKE